MRCTFQRRAVEEGCVCSVVNTSPILLRGCNGGLSDCHVSSSDSPPPLSSGRGLMGSLGRRPCIPVATLRLIAVALAVSITAWTFLLSTGGRYCRDDLRKKVNEIYALGWEDMTKGWEEDDRGVPFVGPVHSQSDTGSGGIRPVRPFGGVIGRQIKLNGEGGTESGLHAQDIKEKDKDRDDWEDKDKWYEQLAEPTGAAEPSLAHQLGGLPARRTSKSSNQLGATLQEEEGGGVQGGGVRSGNSSSSSSSSSASSSSSSSSSLISGPRGSSPTTEEDVSVMQTSRLHPPTYISNIVFGIAAAASLWEERKEYVKLWWKPQYRGYVWFDEPVIRGPSERHLYPQFRISEDITNFLFTNTHGVPAGIRLTRIVSETFRMGLPDVHWFVMGDDDTVFSAENLAAVLSKYDHREMYYIGSHSESHTQDVHFSYSMAFGGGGVAVSYPLAEALLKSQDDCIGRYPELYGSDDRLQACVAELGVPLTREAGFHQMDIYGNPFGVLSTHPVAPFISMHHVGVIDPLIPGASRLDGLKRATLGLHVNPGSFLQQTIYINKTKKFSLSVAFGYSVQFFPSAMRVRELERPELTFESWHHSRVRYEFPFNVRVPDKSVCKHPSIFFVTSVTTNEAGQVVSVYSRDATNDRKKIKAWCRSSIFPKEDVKEVTVIKEPVDWRWFKTPRRMCCKSVEIDSSIGTATIRIGLCSKGEVIA